MAENNGKSSVRNFGTFESLKARIKTMSSFNSGSARFKEPAITNTDFTWGINK